MMELTPQEEKKIDPDVTLADQSGSGSDIIKFSLTLGWVAGPGRANPEPIIARKILDPDVTRKIIRIWI